MRPTRPVRRRTAGARIAAAVVIACVAVATGCELREVTLAEAEDVIIAEVVLRAGAVLQTALLHRTLAGADGVGVPGAEVEASSAAGEMLRYREAPIERCITPDSAGALPPPATRAGTCYVAEGADAATVLPGARWSLRIRTADGRELTGATTVPGAFALRTPAPAHCALPPGGTLLLAWTPAAGTWAYLAEARFGGLRAALAELGIEVPAEPLALTGVAVSRGDTTMALPGAFGLFDRFDRDLSPTLVALQQGIPAGVSVALTVAAADRNFVNWVRGGNFNPSGLVRVPSVRGGGTGVFGSLVLREARVETAPASPLPGC